MPTSKWLPRPRSDAQFRLFCFPFAGGGASIYRSWAQHLPPEVDVCPVQLPGRENRLKEPLFTSLPLLVTALVQELIPFFDRPFAFFGHSMGALISFDLARLLRHDHQPMPRQLFVSAHRAPQLPLSREALYTLPAPEFLRSVYRMGGTPPAVLLNQELVRLFLPILRADFQVYETYHYTEGEPLICPITAFGGEQDRLITKQELLAWHEQTSSAFTLHMLPGNHFFLQSNPQDLLSLISQDLLKHLK